MKNVIVCMGFLILALFMCGCTTTSQEPAPTVHVTSDLLGNWSGTMYGYIEGTGYTNFSEETMTMMVTEQHDRVFSGVMTFSNQVFHWEDKAFAGIISPDGMTLTIVEHGGGISSGTINGNEIELTYLDTGEPFMVAVDSLKKA